MRSDLNKQLCERERYGSKRSYKTVRRSKKFQDKEEFGEGVARKEGMTRRHAITGNTKDFNENLNPLWGAVRKAVGRKWDKFYSELCKTFDKRSVINQHILQHLEQHVELNIVVKEDGEYYVRGKYSLSDKLLKDSSVEYYVDPKDGILKRNKHHKSYKQVRREYAEETKKKLDAVFHKIDDSNVLHFIDGIWYHFTLKDIPKGSYVYKKPHDKDQFQSSYGGKIKSWGQLSDFEKQRHGVQSFVGERARDLKTGDIVYDDGKPRHRYASTPTYPIGKKYHATKQTASHKILKKAGII